MALYWEWKDRCGTARFERLNDNNEVISYDVNLYQGNAMLILIFEFEANGIDQYQLHSFFCDKEHLLRCLDDDIYNNKTRDPKREQLTYIELSKSKNSKMKQIIDALLKYYDNLTIKIIP